MHKPVSATIRLRGRVLYLTEDPELVARQLEGHDLPFDPSRPLRDNISTDEITPGWACLHYDETLGQYCYAGLSGVAVTPGVVRRAGFEVVVSGLSKGCGSSRETAPFAERVAGIRIVFARTIEKIYRQNAHNLGLLTSTDFTLLERLVRGEEVPLAAFLEGLDELSREVVAHGGLFGYADHRMQIGCALPPRPSARLSPRPSAPFPPTRPMTAVEKIIAAHARPRAGAADVSFVVPGDALFVRADVRFSHEYVTPMADALFRAGFGGEASIAEPESVYLFRDHLTLLERLEPRSAEDSARRERARGLAVVQEQFARRHRLRLLGEVRYADDGRMGAQSICHNHIVEHVALPGQIVVGSDSHTSTAGALGCFAFGIGSTDLALAWRTAEVRVTVPETVRIVVRGALAYGVCAKDVMLQLAALPFFREGGGIGRVVEFAGEGLGALSLDERATLANMAVEVGAVTAIIEPDPTVVDEVARSRGIEPEAVAERIVRSDDNADFANTLFVDLASVVPMVAFPGDPRSAVPIGELGVRSGGEVRIDIAYGGSCTGSKRADLDAYAAVLGRAVAEGRRVASGVRLYIQLGSLSVRRYAEERGYLDLFRRAGADVLEPGCGACIGAGPGVSTRKDEVTVSAASRNFPGRSGPGKVYLASPWVVAASALRGSIAAPERLESCEPTALMANSPPSGSPRA